MNKRNDGRWTGVPKRPSNTHDLLQGQAKSTTALPDESTTYINVGNGTRLQLVHMRCGCLDICVMTPMTPDDVEAEGGRNDDTAS